MAQCRGAGICAGAGRPKGMNATIAGAASVSTSSSPVSAVEALTLCRTGFPTGSADPCSRGGPGATAKTGREEALLLAVEIRLRGSRHAVRRCSPPARVGGRDTREGGHCMGAGGLCPGLSSPSIQTQLRQDEVTTLTMQPQPLYLSTPTRATPKSRLPSSSCTCRHHQAPTPATAPAPAGSAANPGAPCPRSLQTPSSPHPNEAPTTRPAHGCRPLVGWGWPQSAPSDDLGSGFLDDDPWVAAASASMRLTGGLTNETPPTSGFWPLRTQAPPPVVLPCGPAQAARTVPCTPV